MSIPTQSTQSLYEQINTLHNRYHNESQEHRRTSGDMISDSPRPGTGMRPTQLPEFTPRGTPGRTRKPLDLPVPSYQQKESNAAEIDRKMQEIMKSTGILEINGKKFLESSIQDLEHIGELGSGTCGLVVKMLHKPSNTVIAVKQMRRSGNNEENKRIIMDLDVVLKSHDCPYIVQCLGCFITESDVWICMELMATCFDKLLKKLRIRIPEDILGKVTCATVRALDYLKEEHGVIHRDVKPSNILLDEKGNVKLCDFGISGRLVDSKAATTSAGCAAYLAPERIAPTNPNKPDYDIRADVWSLGITLIELATGVFPYRQCNSDFEVLAKVVTGDPPTLPADQEFSPEFRSFVNGCLIKNYKDRPKYKKLLEHPWIKRSEASQVDVGAWFAKTVPSSSSSSSSSSSRRSPALEQPGRRGLSQFSFSSAPPRPPENNMFQDKSREINASESSQRNLFWQSKSRFTPAETAHSKNTSYFNLGFSGHNRINRSSGQQNIRNHSGFTDQGNANQRMPPTSSPQSMLVNQSGISSINQRTDFADHSPPSSSPSLVTNYNECGSNQSSLPTNYVPSSGLPISNHRGAFQRFWTAKPKAPVTHHFNSYPNDGSQHGATPEMYRAVLRSQSPASQITYSSVGPAVTTYQSVVPAVYSTHTVYSSQSSPQPSAETNHTDSNCDNKRYSCYLKFHFGGGKEGSTRTSSLPPVPRPARQLSPSVLPSSSPEPPPRLNRLSQRSDEASPLPMRRAFLDHSPIRRLDGSPSLSRRYISPTPPQPPPRRLSECSSVPGSPQHHRVQHYRTRLHYTPEPQRRLFDSGQQF